MVFIIKGLILLIGFPNNKYPPTKKFLPCLLRGGRLVLGGRDDEEATGKRMARDPAWPHGLCQLHLGTVTRYPGPVVAKFYKSEGPQTCCRMI
jgi:hypothetical protein